MDDDDEGIISNSSLDDNEEHDRHGQEDQQDFDGSQQDQVEEVSLIDIRSTFANDESLRPFIQDDFDAARYNAAIVSGLIVGASLEKLNKSIHTLDKQLELQVVSHHSDLLQQATGIQKLEDILEMLRSRVDSLQQHVARVRERVSEPYKVILNKTRQLETLQSACDLLRKVARFVQLAKKLKAQAFDSASKDIIKAAQTLNELEFTLQEVDMRGIDIVDSETQWIASVKVSIEQESLKLLSKGLEAQNQADIATALQVFHNINQLSERVETCVQNVQSFVVQSLKSALNVDSFAADASLTGGAQAMHPGSLKGNAPSAGASASWRAVLWTRLDKLSSAIQSAASQILVLQKVLVKRRDPTTHATFIDIVRPSPPNLITSFWIDVTTLLLNEFSNAARNSSFVKNTFESEFPKLVRVTSELWDNIGPLLVDVSAQLPGKTKDNQPNTPQDLLRNCLAPFENAYLSRCLSRMFDPVNSAFPAGSSTPPPAEDIANIIRTISNELQVSSVDPFLASLVAKNVSKTIRLYTVKTEGMVATDADATQVSGPTTSSQSRNIQLMNLLETFHRGILGISFVQTYLTAVNNGNSQFNTSTQTYKQVLVGTAVNTIIDTLKEVTKLLEATMTPLFDSISAALESKLLKMHSTDYSKNESPNPNDPGPPCSPFINEFSALIAHVSSEILARFKCEDALNTFTRNLISRLLVYFVRHASLVRPLGEAGKLKLAADLAQFEVALSPLQSRAGVRVSDLGQPYRMLRAFRPMLFLDVQQIINSSSAGETLPYSFILHHLFSRAPEDLQSPHVRAQMTILKYSQWLDAHSEQEALLFIRATLEAYALKVKAKGEKQYVTIYPIMIELLSKIIV